jgi:hypothetical protein
MARFSRSLKESVVERSAGQTAVLFELDNPSWETLKDRAEKWFLNVQMIQTGFRKLVEDTLPKINDSNVHQYLKTLHGVAIRHESRAADLLRMIGREPSTARNVAGTGLAKVRELWAGVIGMSGGAVTGWTDLQQILHASLDGIAAFGVANDIGLALGLSDITELTLQVTNEKFVQHYRLQELVLELATISVLYRSEI